MKRRLVIHPLLLAVFPSLFIYAHNADRLSAGAIYGPTLILLCAVSVLWLLLSLALRDASRAGLVVSLAVLLFFSFGICYLEMKLLMLEVSGGTVVAAPVLLLVLWMVILGVGGYSFARTILDLRSLTNIANVVGGCLVLVCLLQIAAYHLRVAPTWRPYVGEVTSRDYLTLGPEVGVAPDIYYIVLDGYARGDTLTDIYGYDNQEFLDGLRDRGFFVASQSHANYCQTLLSLASSLNLTYLDGLVDQVGAEYPSKGPIMKMIRSSMAFRALESRGYETIAFASGYSGTEITTAERYVAARRYPDEFQTTLINMTPLPFVVPSLYDMYGWHRERILHAFEHTADPSVVDAPVFVFAHIMAPHPPFVFGRSGEEVVPEYQYVVLDGSDLVGTRGVTQEAYARGYVEQLTFVNAKVLSMLDEILSKSDRPTIVVLQADHGPGSMLDWDSVENSNLPERFAILNAYYLPGVDYAGLYPQISPVNTFRVIFNSYFGAHYDLLADESYFSTAGHPYSFVRVTDHLGGRVGPDTTGWIAPQANPRWCTSGATCP